MSGRPPSRPKARPGRRRGPAPPRKRREKTRRTGLRARALPAAELEALRAELERSLPEGDAARWNADPEDVQRQVVRLVLTLVEFLRKIMERQAIRRMEAKTLSAEQVEAVGLALMRLEKTLHQLARRFGLRPEELTLELGPLGRLS